MMLHRGCCRGVRSRRSLDGVINQTSQPGGPPRNCNRAIGNNVNRNDVGRYLPVRQHGSQCPNATTNNTARNALETLNPSWFGVPPRGRHYGWANDGARDSPAFLLEIVLAESFSPCVAVVSRCQRTSTTPSRATCASLTH
jgi:hypothetical protein